MTPEFKRNVKKYMDEDFISFSAVSARNGYKGNQYRQFYTEVNATPLGLTLEAIDTFCWYLRCHPWQLFTEEPVTRVERNNYEVVNSKKLIKETLAYHMEKRGLTRKECSLQSGVTIPLFLDYLRNGKLPPDKMIQTLADFFHISYADMFRDDING